MPHTCKALILHCMDFRLGPAVRDWLDTHGLLGDCDIVSHAGATRDMTVPMSQIDLSKRLHGISRIILMNHTDCGAYGGRAAFDSDKAETEAHFSDMQKAREALLAAHPDLEARTVLARIHDDGEITFEERP